MTAPFLIGLYSPVPGSGKSTIASFYCSQGYHIVSFASVLKDMCRLFLLTQCIPPAQVDYYMCNAKNDKIPELGVSARHLMQTLGTEWGRTCVDPDVWVRTWTRQVEMRLKAGGAVVCDDIRYFNEASALLRLGGELWHVTRPSIVCESTHQSEGNLDNFGVFHRFIVNSASIDDLHQCLPRFARAPHARSV
jgi:hypothetical protein